MVPGGGREERDVLTDALADELLAAPLIAKLATFNADGTIHLVPMWFAWEPPALLIPTSSRTRKCRNLARDPRATVMIDDSRGGLDLRGVTLVGEAEVVGGRGAPEINRAIHLRYLTEAAPLGPDRAATVIERIHQIAAAIESEPKTRKWKLRARIGPRAKWYQEVAEKSETY